MQVNVCYKTAVPAVFRKDVLIKNAVRAALGKEDKKNGIINIVFVSAKEIHSINKQFLNHDYVTDVISFPYGFDKSISCAQPYGDVFVCYKTAKENSALYGHTVLEEMLMYSVHGTLHLVGMDDCTVTLRAAMDKKTYKILKGVLK